MPRNNHLDARPRPSRLARIRAVIDNFQANYTIIFYAIVALAVLAGAVMLVSAIVHLIGVKSPLDDILRNPPTN